MKDRLVPDDVLVYSDNEEEHWMQIEEVIHRLHRKAKLLEKGTS